MSAEQLLQLRAALRCERISFKAYLSLEKDNAVRALLADIDTSYLFNKNGREEHLIVQLLGSLSPSEQKEFAKQELSLLKS